MTLYSRTTKYFSLITIAAFSCWAIAHLSGLRFNTTKSIPLGFYWVSSDPVELGSYVMFCPPNTSVFREAKRRGYLTAGYCKGNFGYMMKKILAAKKDRVMVDERGVHVNSKLLALSKPLKSDGAGRPMPHYLNLEYIIEENDLLLMSDVSNTSFDGRYFGPISKNQVTTVIKPLITW